MSYKIVKPLIYCDSKGVKVSMKKESNSKYRQFLTHYKFNIFSYSTLYREFKMFLNFYPNLARNSLHKMQP